MINMSNNNSNKMVLATVHTCLFSSPFPHLPFPLRIDPLRFQAIRS